MQLKEFLCRRSDTLCFFYIDILDGKSLNDSKIVQLLRDEFKFEMMLRQLSLAHQLKIRNIKNELDRYSKLMNMLILQYVIAKYELNSGILEMTHNDYGKPKLRNKFYQYNISDEEGLVSIAIGFEESLKNCEVGVDLANPKDIEGFKLERLEEFYKHDFRSIYGSREIDMLDEKFTYLSYNDQLLLLSETWALKESYCKYLGVGITSGLEKYQFPKVPEVIRLPLVSDIADGGFEIFRATLPLNIITGYEPKNVCFEIPNRNIICSVFSHYEQARLIKISGLALIEYFLSQDNRR